MSRSGCALGRGARAGRWGRPPASPPAPRVPARWPPPASASPARPRRRGPGGRGRRRRREVSGEVGSRPGTGRRAGLRARPGWGVRAVGPPRPQPLGPAGGGSQPRLRPAPAGPRPRATPPPPAPPPRPGPKPGLPGPPCPALGRVPTRLAVLGRRRGQAGPGWHTCPARGRRPGPTGALGVRSTGGGARVSPGWNPGWSPRPGPHGVQRLAGRVSGQAALFPKCSANTYVFRGKFGHILLRNLNGKSQNVCCSHRCSV